MQIPVTTIDEALHATAVVPARSSIFQTFSVWALLGHLAFYGSLFAAPTLARLWLLPVVHLMAWAVFVGSHVLVAFYPETMHKPRIAGHDHLHGKSFQILVGHEVLHVLPLVALYLVPGVWPAHGAFEPTRWLLGSLPGLVLGAAYVAWQGGEGNAYGAEPGRLNWMIGASTLAGVSANVAALLWL
ncbi:MAG: hypothetical protein JWM80_4217 [Cyanobacteria bacterium RYN_339]|nr:hypothetical protein [Cyanobacteria bacterium RYN_339]